MFSIRLRARLWEIGLAASVIFFVWLFQSNVLTRLSFAGLMCNLPLTFTIVWATVFGSRLAPLTADNFRLLSLNEIIAYQAVSGSLSGALIGAIFASLYSSVLPVFPISYPLIGWIAGYFSLKKMNQAQFLTIPIVLFASVLAEAFMAIQLYLLGRPEIISRFIDAALPEAVMNALIAPWIYLPMRSWYEFRTTKQVAGIK
jgi:rod shape-determining protein MreD